MARTKMEDHDVIELIDTCEGSMCNRHEEAADQGWRQMKLYTTVKRESLSKEPLHIPSKPAVVDLTDNEPMLQSIVTYEKEDKSSARNSMVPVVKNDPCILTPEDHSPGARATITGDDLFSFGRPHTKDLSPARSSPFSLRSEPEPCHMYTAKALQVGTDRRIEQRPGMLSGLTDHALLRSKTGTAQANPLPKSPTCVERRGHVIESKDGTMASARQNLVVSTAKQIFGSKFKPKDVFATIQRDHANCTNKSKQSELKSGHKRLLTDIPLGTLFKPRDVATSHEYDRYVAAKKQRREEARNCSAGHLDSNVKVVSQESSKSYPESRLCEDTMGLSQESQPCEEKLNEEHGISVPRSTALMTVAAGESLPVATSPDLDVGVDSTECLDVQTSIYIYFVDLRNWGASLTEDKATQRNLGPYYSLTEANIVAAKEVKTPLQRHVLRMENEDEGSYQRNRVRPAGWSYTFNEDEQGMQTHDLTAGYFQARATVRRELAPLPNSRPLPAAAFRTSPYIYIAHAINRFYITRRETYIRDLFSDEIENKAEELPECEYTVLGTFSVPDLACHAAGEYFAHMATGGMKRSQRDQIKMDLRLYLDRLKVGGYEDLFCKAVEFERVDEAEEGGEEEVEEGEERIKRALCTVWVEESRVVGPRN